jgi:hypothetical protein
MQLQHVYIVTRLDIPQPHRTVQVAHAGIAAANAFGMPVYHPNLVVCAVANEQELDALFNDLKERGVPCCAWNESDMNDELTAIATAALGKDQRKVFRGLNLLDG